MEFEDCLCKLHIELTHHADYDYNQEFVKNTTSSEHTLVPVVKLLLSHKVDVSSPRT